MTGASCGRIEQPQLRRELLFVCMFCFISKWLILQLNFLTKTQIQAGINGHTPVISALGQVISEFEVELVYPVNPRPARATQWILGQLRLHRETLFWNKAKHKHKQKPLAHHRCTLITSCCQRWELTHTITSSLRVVQAGAGIVLCASSCGVWECGFLHRDCIYVLELYVLLELFNTHCKTFYGKTKGVLNEQMSFHILTAFL